MGQYDWDRKKKCDGIFNYFLEFKILQFKSRSDFKLTSLYWGGEKSHFAWKKKKKKDKTKQTKKLIHLLSILIKEISSMKFPRIKININEKNVIFFIQN